MSNTLSYWLFFLLHARMWGIRTHVPREHALPIGPPHKHTYWHRHMHAPTLNHAHMHQHTAYTWVYTEYARLPYTNQSKFQWHSNNIQMFVDNFKRSIIQIFSSSNRKLRNFSFILWEDNSVTFYWLTSPTSISLHSTEETLLNYSVFVLYLINVLLIWYCYIWRQISSLVLEQHPQQ